MEELIQAVEEILNSNFSGLDNVIELDETVPGQKIGGSFVSAAFSGMPQTDRQKTIRETLRTNLPRTDYLSIGLILTLTPQEVASMQGIAVVG